MWSDFTLKKIEVSAPISLYFKITGIRCTKEQAEDKEIVAQLTSTAPQKGRSLTRFVDTTYYKHISLHHSFLFWYLYIYCKCFENGKAYFSFIPKVLRVRQEFQVEDILEMELE